MTKPFAFSFTDLDRDAERHADAFGEHGEILGTPAVFGFDKSLDATFAAYEAHGAEDEICAWLMRHQTYDWGTNEKFDATIERYRRAGAHARIMRLWRHATGSMVEHYRAQQNLLGKGVDEKSVEEVRTLALNAFHRWRTDIVDLAPPADVARLDAKIAAFETGQKPKIRKKPDPRPIDNDLFWEIIDTAGPDDPIEDITSALSAFRASAIKSFDDILWAEMERLYDWDLWALAYLVYDGCSDDSFMEFRSGLILRGRDWAVMAPSALDGLATHLVDTAPLDGGALLSVAAEAHERRTGKPMPFKKRRAVAPSGEPWAEDDIEVIHEALAATVNALRS